MLIQLVLMMLAATAVGSSVTTVSRLSTATLVWKVRNSLLKNTLAK